MYFNAFHFVGDIVVKSFFSLLCLLKKKGTIVDTAHSPSSLLDLVRLQGRRYAYAFVVMVVLCLTL
jgi:hypothetical protein